MNIFIARDGVEIGEYSREEIERRARAGELRPSDHYWHEGMANWLPLQDLLAAEAREAAAVTEQPPSPASSDVAENITAKKEEPRAAPRGDQSSRNLRIAVICGALLIVLGIIAYFISSARSHHTQKNALLLPPAGVKATPPPDEVRDKAAAELRAKVEQLPARPAPPLQTFYYDVSVNMQKTLSSHVPWTAVIRGGENVVDPETDKTTVHTDFTLSVEFRDGEWVFNHYRASVSDMVKEQTTEIEEDVKTPAPPSIVGILGLKMPPTELPR